MSLPTCVKCEAEVLVPAGASLESRVRCPHCGEEFALSDMLAELPPALELVEDPKSESRSSFSFSFSDSDSASQTSDGPDSAGDETDPSEFHLEGHSSDEAQHPAAFKFDDDAPAGNGESAASTYRPGSRPQRKKKSPAVEIAKVAGGGALGILLAVVGIWWIAGKDPFKLAPTVRGFAPWALPASLRGNGNPGEEANDQDNDSSGKGKRSPQTALPQVNPNSISTSPIPDASVGFMSSFNSDGTPKNNKKKNGGNRKNNPAKGNGNTKVANGGNAFQGIRGAQPATVEEFETSVFAALNDFKDWEASAGRDRQAEDFFTSVATLGQTATNVNQNDPEAEMGLQNVDKLMQGLTEEGNKLKLLMEWSAERLNEFSVDETGILLAGKIKSVEPQGKLFETRLELLGRPGHQVSVMTAFDIRAKAKPDMHLLVLGAICYDPSKNLGGYSGSRDNVIVTARMFPLPDDASPFEEVVTEPVKPTAPEKSPFEPVDQPKTPEKSPFEPVDQPTVSPPTIDVPKVDVPKVDVPRVDAPQIEPPKVPAPSIDEASPDAAVKSPPAKTEPPAADTLPKE